MERNDGIEDKRNVCLLCIDAMVFVVSDPQHKKTKWVQQLRDSQEQRLKVRLHDEGFVCVTDETGMIVGG